jgi:hypothetical protein
MDLSTLAHVVLASCVLHNICEALKNEFLPDWADAEVLIEEPIYFQLMKPQHQTQS